MHKMCVGELHHCLSECSGIKFIIGLPHTLLMIFLTCVSEYYRVVQDDLALSNGSCVAAIRDATQELSLLLKDSLGHKTVNEMFK
jgi:hypothetical protein